MGHGTPCSKCPKSPKPIVWGAELMLILLLFGAPYTALGDNGGHVVPVWQLFILREGLM